MGLILSLNKDTYQAKIWTGEKPYKMCDILTFVSYKILTKTQSVHFAHTHTPLCTTTNTHLKSGRESKRLRETIWGARRIYLNCLLPVVFQTLKNLSDWLYNSRNVAIRTRYISLWSERWPTFPHTAAKQIFFFVLWQQMSRHIQETWKRGNTKNFGMGMSK